MENDSKEPLNQKIYHVLTTDENDQPPTETNINETGIRRPGWKNRVAAFSGNFLEWYDFSVYGYFSDIIGQNFFPTKNKTTNLGLSFLIFGAAFVARPVGSLVLGQVADRYGTKVSVEISIMMMGVASCLIGVLPSYSAAGYFGAVMLLLLRLVQGFSMGGQYVVSMFFAINGVSRDNHAYEYAIAGLSGNAGFLFGNLVSYFLRSVLSKDQLHDWGWRLPFFVAVLACPAALYLKMAVDHGHGPPGGEANQNLSQSKLIFQRYNWKPMMMVAGVTSAASSCGYILFVWLPAYMSDLSKPHIANAYGINSIAQFVSQIALIPVLGIIVDRTDAKVNTLIYSFGQAIFFPICLSIIHSSKSQAFTLVTMILIGTFNAGLNPCAMFSYFHDKFPPQIRITSIAFGYNIAAACIGGFSPAMATFTYKIDSLAPAFIVTVTSTFSIIGVLSTWDYVPPNLSEDGSIATADGDTERNENRLPSSAALEEGTASALHVPLIGKENAVERQSTFP